MTAPFEDKLQNFAKLGECPICLELKQDNRVLLPCGHSVCKECLDVLLRQNSTCPECKQKFVVPADGNFLKDFRKNQLVELLSAISIKKKCSECGNEATVWCQDCNANYCSDDDAAAHKMKALQTHKRLSITKRKPPKPNALCSQHPTESLVDYCLQCSTYICTTCYKYIHSGHNVAPTMDEECESEKKILFEKWSKVTAPAISAIKIRTEEASALLNSLEAHFSTVETNMEKMFQNLISIINSQHKIAQEQLQSKRTQEIQSLKLFQEKLQHQSELLSSEHQIISSATDSKVSIAQWVKIEEQINTTLQKIEKPMPLEELKAVFSFWNMKNCNLQEFHTASFVTYLQKSLTEWSVDKSVIMEVFPSPDLKLPNKPDPVISGSFAPKGTATTEKPAAPLVSNSIFGPPTASAPLFKPKKSTSGDNPFSSMFPNLNPPKPEPASSPKPLFETTSSLFGAKTAAQEPTPLFGTKLEDEKPSDPKPTTEESKKIEPVQHVPLFGSTPTKPRNSFGQPSTFGQVSPLSSPFSQPATSSFGQTSASVGQPSAFASFANQQGTGQPSAFGTLANPPPAQPSASGQSTIFGGGSIFGAPATNSAFGGNLWGARK